MSDPHRLALDTSRLPHTLVHAEPQHDRQADAQWAKAERTDDREKRAEEGDGLADDPADETSAVGGAQPNGPVLPGVGRQVRRAAKESDEDGLAGDVDADHGASDESGNGKTVRDDLDGRTSRAQRRRCEPLASEAEHDHTDDHVASGDPRHDDVQALEEILRLPHLRDDGDEARGVGAASEDDQRRSPGTSKRRALSRPRRESQVKVTGRRSGSRSITDTRCDEHRQDRGHNGAEADPADPCQLLDLADTGDGRDDDVRAEAEDDAASAVPGDRVESNRQTQRSQASGENPGDDIHHLCHISRNRCPLLTSSRDLQRRNLRTIRHSMHTRMRDLETSLELCHVGVEQAPEENEETSSDGAKLVEGRREGEDAGTESHLEEEDGGADPADGAEVDMSFARGKDFGFAAGGGLFGNIDAIGVGGDRTGVPSFFVCHDV